jgi:hypothetical protein
MSSRPIVIALCGCLSLVSVGCNPASPTGSTNTGGRTDSGGSTSTGGNAGSGGNANTGGNNNTGGDKTGGTQASGGSGNTGGTNRTGGSGNTGGNRTGGSGNTGGTNRTGGSGNTGGTTGSGGSPATGGTTSTGGTNGGTSCTFDIQAVTATAIPTVGVVTWGTTLSSPASAYIEFGLDNKYGMKAPVDKPSASGNKTLLLGMKQKKPYHYRIVAKNGSGECMSEDKTIETGSLPNGLPTIKVANKGDTKTLFGGFLITAQYQGSSGGKAPALIYDQDGDIVWAYSLSTSGDGLTCARMSYGGTHMWINSANVGAAMMGGGMGNALVHRVAMDGSDDQNLSSKFAGLNHSLTVLPDETVAYYGYSSNGCDDIKEYSPNGTTKTIVNSGTAQGGASACHVNNIQYADDDSLIFSDLDSQVVVKVSRKDGSTIWSLNHGKNLISGVTWQGSEHGIHVLDPNHILLFNNNSRALMGGMGTAGGTGDGSIALEIKVDPAAKTASKVWSYKGPSNLQNDVMGDLQRLPNGNTIIAYSTKGAVQEVDKDGKVLSDWTFPLGAQFGYIEKRATLYGPPPR